MMKYSLMGIVMWRLKYHLELEVIIPPSIINELLSDTLGETLEDILLEDDIFIVGEGVFDLEMKGNL